MIRGLFKLMKWGFIGVFVAGLFTYPGGISGILKNFHGPDNSSVRGYVVLAGDADTIAVMSREKKGYIVRLAGVDAPETSPVSACYGVKATRYAEEQIGRKNVRVEADPSHPINKKYHRIFGYLYYANGTNFNVELLRNGYAKLYLYKGKKPKLYNLLKKAEDEAKAAQRGIWNPKACT